MESGFKKTNDTVPYELNQACTYRREEKSGGNKISWDIPFQQSINKNKENLARGHFNVPEPVHIGLGLGEHDVDRGGSLGQRFGLVGWTHDEGGREGWLTRWRLLLAVLPLLLPPAFGISEDIYVLINLFPFNLP